MSEVMTPATLTAVCLFLLKRSDEAYARAETMRMLLEKPRQEGGVSLSSEQFDALFAQALEKQKERTREWFRRLLTDVQNEEARQFLAAYEGNPQ